MVAIATAHCIRLLIKSKTDVIDTITEQRRSRQHYDSDEIEDLRQEMNLRIGYADISYFALGKNYYHLTQCAIGINQFAITVGYFIVMGNTISRLIVITSTEENNSIADRSEFTTEMSTSKDFSEQYTPTAETATYLNHNSTEPYFGVLAFSELRLVLCTLIPLPILVVLSLMRRLRWLAPFSTIAAVALIISAFSILALICFGLYHIGAF